MRRRPRRHVPSTPSFQGTFLFELCCPPPSNESTWRALLDEDGLIQLAMTRERTGPGPPERTLVATAAVDWRHALLQRGSEMRITLRPCGHDSVLSSDAPGVLKLKLNVAPLAGDSATATELAPTFDEIAIRQQIQRFTAKLGETARAFYLYARKWWQDYTAISSRCAGRSVRLFARDEAGETRCVCTFVSPLAAGRALDSPRHAARFVALLPIERDDSVGGARAETWASPFALSRDASATSGNTPVCCARCFSALGCTRM